MNTTDDHQHDSAREAGISEQWAAAEDRCAAMEFKVGELRAALELIALGPMRDGSYSRDRRACQQLALIALANAPETPHVSMTREDARGCANVSALGRHGWCDRFPLDRAACGRLGGCGAHDGCLVASEFEAQRSS